jgi:hypothetical protein
MYIKNLTSKNIVLAGVLSGKDLVVPADGVSVNFVPNKELLNKFMINHENLELHASRGSELNAAAEIDSRVETLMVLD